MLNATAAIILKTKCLATYTCPAERIEISMNNNTEIETNTYGLFLTKASLNAVSSNTTGTINTNQRGMAFCRKSLEIKEGSSLTKIDLIIGTANEMTYKATQQAMKIKNSEKVFFLSIFSLGYLKNDINSFSALIH